MLDTTLPDMENNNLKEDNFTLNLDRPVNDLVNDNFKAVRIGREVEAKLKSKNKNIIDYPLSNFKSDSLMYSTFLIPSLCWNSPFIINGSNQIHNKFNSPVSSDNS